MKPLLIFENPKFYRSDKLKNKTVITSSGDSGIRRTRSVLFSIEGIDPVINYLNEHENANFTKKYVENMVEDVYLFLRFKRREIIPRNSR